MSTIDLVTFYLEEIIINTKDLWKTEDADEEENQVTHKLFLRYKILPYLELYDIRLCGFLIYGSILNQSRHITVLSYEGGYFSWRILKTETSNIYFVSSARKTLVRFFMARTKKSKILKQSWNYVRLVRNFAQILIILNQPYFYGYMERLIYLILLPNITLIIMIKHLNYLERI